MKILKFEDNLTEIEKFILNHTNEEIIIVCTNQADVNLIYYTFTENNTPDSSFLIRDLDFEVEKDNYLVKVKLISGVLESTQILSNIIK